MALKDLKIWLYLFEKGKSFLPFLLFLLRKICYNCTTWQVCIVPRRIVNSAGLRSAGVLHLSHDITKMQVGAKVIVFFDVKSNGKTLNDFCTNESQKMLLSHIAYNGVPHSHPGNQLMRLCNVCALKNKTKKR